MNQPDDIRQSVQGYFERQLSQSDDDALRVGWNSAEAQQARFAQVMTLIREPGQPFSILDWGCGLGNLVAYLDAHDFDYRYTGYDINTASVLEARTRYADHPRASVFTTDEASLAPHDYVVSVGIFNIKGEIPTARWEPYVLGTIAHQWAYTKQGLAASFLTAYSDTDRMDPALYYPQPEVLFGYAKRALSRNVALLHDYDLYDCTLLVRRA